MMTITVVLGAAILLFALYRRREVKFSLRIGAANVVLEARDQHEDDGHSGS
jgi:hypothetical protein